MLATVVPTLERHLSKRPRHLAKVLLPPHVAATRFLRICRKPITRERVTWGEYLILFKGGRSFCNWKRDW